MKGEVNMVSLSDYDIRRLAKGIVKEMAGNDRILEAIRPPERIIGVDEAAQILGVTVSHIYHNLEQIPHTNYHRRLRFSERELVALIKEHQNNN